MGKKVHPYVFRIGEVNPWKSRWFDDKKFKGTLEEDFIMRKFVTDKLKKMGLSHVDIERSARELKILIHTSRPGLIIGKGGAGIETLKREVERLYKRIKKDKAAKIAVKLEIEEVQNPDINSQLVGQSIADQIEKRIPFRRALKQAIEKVMQNRNVKGVKIEISGRLDGSEMARTEKLGKGKIPLQTIRSNIDYAQVNAYCRYGVVGINVWIYKGDVFNEDKKTVKKEK